MKNRKVVLISRPHGLPQQRHFEVRTSALPDIGENQILVENLLLSIDPAQRGYVNEESNYTPPVPIGDVMRSLAIGRVVASNHLEFTTGEYLYGWFGWQDYCACGADAVLRRVKVEQAPFPIAAGVLGINGLTAEIALRELAAPSAGETVVVTAAAGAVGSLVGQLASLYGCRTVAIVGSEKKGRQCTNDFGYAGYINYRRPWADALRQECPRGIDVFFDNVGGDLLDGVLRQMNPLGRVIICGTVATTSWIPPPLGLRNEREILTRRLRVAGFVIFDHISKFDAVAEKLAQLFAQGRLRAEVDIELGLERAPGALLDVYAGRNRGKKLIRLREEG